MNRFYVFFLAGLITCPSYARRIALSFDDAPRPSGELYYGFERAEIIIDQLKAGKVKQAVFFANTAQISYEGQLRLVKYATNGHLIANKAQLDPNGVGLRNFVRDLRQADEILSPLSTFRPWFRLSSEFGSRLSEQNEIEDALSERGYRNGYVTVNTADWYMDALVQQALSAGKKLNIQRLKETYAQIIWDAVRFYDHVALQTLKRSPNHVLHLHENDLAALCLDTLIAKIRNQGWQIISPDEAYSDPVAEMEPDDLKLNQARIAGLAQANGYQGPTSSPWEREQAIESEFKRRQVFEEPSR